MAGSRICAAHVLAMAVVLVSACAQGASPPAAWQTLPVAQTATRTLERQSPRLFFSIRWPDHAQIIAMNADGSGRVCLTPRTDSDYYCSLSPDGATIAFTS